jgi:hypothetical protein
MLFIDDQVIMASTEDELQRAVYTLNYILVAITPNWYISADKIQEMALKGKMNVRTKTIINNDITKHVNSFNYLGYIITATKNRNLEIKINKFNQMCSTIRTTLNKKTRNDTQLKIYKAMAVPTLTYGSQIWITKKEEAKIERAEMKFLRSVVDYTRTK